MIDCQTTASTTTHVVTCYTFAHNRNEVSVFHRMLRENSGPATFVKVSMTQQKIRVLRRNLEFVAFMFPIISLTRGRSARIAVAVVVWASSFNQSCGQNISFIKAYVKHHPLKASERENVAAVFLAVSWMPSSKTRLIFLHAVYHSTALSHQHVITVVCTSIVILLIAAKARYASCRTYSVECTAAQVDTNRVDNIMYKATECVAATSVETRTGRNAKGAECYSQFNGRLCIMSKDKRKDGGENMFEKSLPDLALRSRSPTSKTIPAQRDPEISLRKIYFKEIETKKHKIVIQLGLFAASRHVRRAFGVCWVGQVRWKRRTTNENERRLIDAKSCPTFILSQPSTNWMTSNEPGKVTSGGRSGSIDEEW